MEYILINGLIVEPNECPYDITLINDKDFIEFHLLEFPDDECSTKIIKIADDACIIYNSLAKTLNRIVYGKIIYGNFYIVGVDKNKTLVSLSDNAKIMYTQMFGYGMLLV
ncbi:MAG: hypothetical protein II998_09590 [Clostridia bacterium]|nr:hypothetical protein [Clostridia bacterium]